MSVRPGRASVPALEGFRTSLLVLGVALLGACGVLGLFEPTETRYAEIAREMLQDGDWLVPRLDGLPHFHKPPLPYWAAASGMAILGVNEWGARLPVALASLATLALAGWIAARRFEALGVRSSRAAWVLGSMLLFALLGRALAADPFLMVSVAAYWALAPSSLALAALGLGFLAKGPVVFVHTALPVLAAALWARDRRFLALLGPRRGWIAFALVALPWYLVTVAVTPGLLAYFLGDQVWVRFATETHGRSGPPWYFIAVLLAGAAPWTVALLLGVVRTWRERDHPEARLLLCWLLAPVAFLSFSGSKLPAYLLPCLPAAAILAARSLDSRAARWGSGTTLMALAVAAAILGGPALARSVGAGMPRDLSTWVLIAAGFLGLAGIAAAWGRHSLAALLVTFALTAGVAAVYPYESALGSPRRVVELLTEQLRPRERVIEVGRFNAGLPFYLEELVPLLEVPRETGFDAEAGRGVFATRDSVQAWAERHGRVWTFGRESDAREVAAGLGLGYFTVARWRREALGVIAAP